MPFAEYLRAAVLGPLEMRRGAARLGRARSCTAASTTLVRFAAELQRPRLIAPETLAEATSVQFPGLVGVLPDIGRMDPNDWGLGFELRDEKRPHWTGSQNSPRTFGHYGSSGTFLWVDPEADVALACLTDLDFGPWALEAWPRAGRRRSQLALRKRPHTGWPVERASEIADRRRPPPRGHRQARAGRDRQRSAFVASAALARVAYPGHHKKAVKALSPPKRFVQHRATKPARVRDPGAGPGRSLGGDGADVNRFSAMGCEVVVEGATAGELAARAGAVRGARRGLQPLPAGAAS